MAEAARTQYCSKVVPLMICGGVFMCFGNAQVVLNVNLLVVQVFKMFGKLTEVIIF